MGGGGHRMLLVKEERKHTKHWAGSRVKKYKNPPKLDQDKDLVTRWLAPKKENPSSFAASHLGRKLERLINLFGGACAHSLLSFLATQNFFPTHPDLEASKHASQNKNLSPFYCSPPRLLVMSWLKNTLVFASVGAVGGLAFTWATQAKNSGHASTKSVQNQNPQNHLKNQNHNKNSDILHFPNTHQALLMLADFGALDPAWHSQLTELVERLCGLSVLMSGHEKVRAGWESRASEYVSGLEEMIKRFHMTHFSRMTSAPELFQRAAERLMSCATDQLFNIRQQMALKIQRGEII